MSLWDLLMATTTEPDLNLSDNPRHTAAPKPRDAPVTTAKPTPHDILRTRQCVIDCDKKIIYSHSLFIKCGVCIIYSHKRAIANARYGHG